LAVTIASGFINLVARGMPDYAQHCNETMQVPHPNGWTDSERSKIQMAESRKRARLVLIASDGEWSGRSLESVLELNGYSVVRVERGRRALELARRTPLDAIFLDAATTDMGGIEVCRALRDDPLFDHSTPIVITSSVAGAHRAGAAAFAAGAWEYCSQPFDVETLMLKLGTFVRAADTVRDARGGGLLDSATGLYSTHGLELWARHLGARAIRQHEALACVAVRPNPGGEVRVWSSGEYASDEITREIVGHDALLQILEVCREESRRSDVLGYLGSSRLAILAPDTDAGGAEQLVNRLSIALERSGSVGAGRAVASVSAGYCAISDLSSAGVEATELLRRAEVALDHVRMPVVDRAPLNYDRITV
jgi:PleD family two-component response regulator